LDGDDILIPTRKLIVKSRRVHGANIVDLFHMAVEYFFKIHMDPAATKDIHAKKLLCDVVKWCVLGYARSCSGVWLTVELAYGGLVMLCQKHKCQVTDVASQLRAIYDILNEEPESEEICSSKVLVYCFWKALKRILNGGIKQHWNFYHELFCVQILGADCSEIPAECAEGLKKLAAQCTDEVDRYMLDHCVLVTEMWVDIYEAQKADIPDLSEWTEDVGKCHAAFIKKIETKYQRKLPLKSAKQNFKLYATSFLSKVNGLLAKPKGFSNYDNPSAARIDYTLAKIRADAVLRLYEEEADDGA
jgi:hypothetical protein